MVRREDRGAHPRRGPAATGVLTAPRFRAVTSLDEAAALVPAWDALADASGAGLLTRPGFALGWWRTLGRGRLLIGTVWRGDELVALAPLHERWIGAVRVARWLGHGLGTVSEALVRPDDDEAARVMWQGLSRRGRVLELLEYREEGGGLAALVDHPPARRRTTVAERDVCLALDFEPGGSGLEHLTYPGRGNVRGALRRADREVEATGEPFTLEVVTDVATFDARLPALQAVYDAAEADNPRQNMLRPPYEDFVVEVWRAGIADGTAAVTIGLLGDRPVALQLCLMDGRTCGLWAMRFAPDVAPLRPGHLLLRETCVWLAARGYQHFDLLIGESQTKRQWSTSRYLTLEVTHGHPLDLRAAAAASGAVARARDLLGARRAARSAG
ncbi:hypothetical protein GCM10023340_04370 [Nocardioides marinquilinus]|uniref:BioF2-like acetyltransferase domain-containing protein n=1 Tax=Nocardioides marinquilinus TaxID=1210400 RepID=A0ABP9P7Z6_9ACTN